VRFAASWLLAALVVTGARGANAEPPPIVRVFVAGTPEAVSGMRDALQDQCARPNLAVMVQDAASADAELLDTAHSAGLADAYVDLRPDNETRVVIVDGQTHEQLEERTLGRAPSLDVSIEMVAQVMCSAIDSTLAARAAPASAPPPRALPPAAPPRLIPVAPEPENRPRSADRVSAAWAGIFGVASNTGAGVHGGGGAIVGASVGSRPVRFGGALLVDGFPSVGLERQGAQASLDVYGLRLLALLDWEMSPRLSAFAGLGGGADWLRVAAGSPPSGGVPRDDTSGVEPMLSSLIGARFSLAFHTSAWLAFGADVDLARRRYVNEASGAPALFFESPRARPVGLAGFAVSFEHGAASASPDASLTPTVPQ